GGAGEHAAEQSAPDDADAGAQPGAARLVDDAIVDIDADRAGGGKGEVPVVGLGDVDQELDPSAGECAAHAHPVSGAQPLAILIDDRERNRRPARDRARLRQQLKYVFRRSVADRLRRPRRHPKPPWFLLLRPPCPRTFLRPRADVHITGSNLLWGFVGGSMGDESVILEGVASDDATESL